MQKCLSKLTCLTLKNPVGTDKRLVNIDRLFTQPLTKLSVLKLVDIDVQCFSKSTAVLKQDKLPNLSGLFLSGCEHFYENPDFDWINEKQNFSFRDIHPKHTPRLEKVSFEKCIMSADELRIMSDVMSSCLLRELDISKNRGIEGCLSSLFTNSFPTLQSLTLGKFGLRLNKEDIESLVTASEQGKLPNLRHLFIYGVLTDSTHLFTGREKWNQLLTLRIGGCNVLDLGSEYLSSLQSLDIYETERGDLTIKRCWPHLRTIRSDDEDVLSAVVEGLKTGLLPAMKTVKGCLFLLAYFGFEFHKANITCITQ